MEEEGLEILFRPGTETVLSKQGENVLQYCTVEETAEGKANQETPLAPSPSGEAVENPSSTSPSSPSTEEEQRQESTSDRAFFPASRQGQPPSLPEVNRHDSLVEDDEEDDESASSDHDDNLENENKYHPALKAAVYTEGQEAVWHEDEYSTISSVYVVEPEKNTTLSTTTEELPRRSQNSRKKMKVPFFKTRGKKAQKDQTVSEEVEPTSRSVKIHIKTKKVAKAVLLLPPTGAGGEIKDVNNELIEENKRHASITEKSITARRLLDTVLSGDALDEEESERFAKEAFAHAAAARRLAQEDDGDEEAIELENVMSYLAEEGEQAALQHVRQNSVDEDNDNQGEGEDDDDDGSRYSNAIDLTEMEEANESSNTKKKRRGKFPVSEYASRAVHYLESILPKNIGNEKAEASPEGTSNGHDIWSEAGISTLGLKNDTQEYELDIGEGGDDPKIVHNGAGVLRTVDMMSLSSLNEILDGGGTVGDKKSQLESNALFNEESKRRKQSLAEPSPRAAVQEIGIPTKKKNSGLPPTHPRQNRAGILGLITPKIAKSSNKNNKPKEVVGDDNKNSDNKWGVFFKTPRGSDGVPTQLNLDLEEQEVQKREESCPSATPKSPENKGTDFASPPSSNKPDPSKVGKLMESDGDSHPEMPEDNRYAPAFADEESKDGRGRTHRFRPIPQDNEIELKLSVATHEDKKSENASGDDDAIPEQSSSQQKESEINASDEEARIDLSLSNDDKSEDLGNQDRYQSEDDGNQDRYQTEPVGMTPRRDGLEIEENTNRNVNENTNVASTANKEEQSHNETTAIEKTSDNEDIASDPTSTPNPETDKYAEVKGDDEKEIDSQDKTSHAKSDIKAESKGPKSKIFGRAIDMVGTNKIKRKPLVPISVVEEKYFIDKDMKKTSTEVEPTKMNKNLMPPVPAKTDTSLEIIDDSTTVVQKAISNGASKAVESNEEGDDVVPLNYLSVMLKEKLHVDSENETDAGESNQQRDADSFVEKIRGPRRGKEVPGVALEEIAIRKNQKDRDPSTGNGINAVVVDLAPTPRRPKGKPTAFDDNEETCDPFVKDEEEERQRRKLITERLFKAGRSSPMATKETSAEVIKTAPTVASAESYCEEPVQENVKLQLIDESDANEETIEKNEAHSRTPKLGRGRRKLSMSFLKGTNKRK